MQKQTTYKFKQKAGITDLCNQSPGHMATEWWTEEDWKKWDEGEPARRQRDVEYIAQLHREGRFGEEYDVSVIVAHNPIFDERPTAPTLESLRIIFLNTDNESSKSTPT